MIFFEGKGSEPIESAEHRELVAERPTSPYGKVLARHSGVISSYADELRGYILKKTEAGTYQHIHFFERGFESTSEDYPTLRAAIVGAFQDASSRRGYWSEPWLNRLTMDASNAGIEPSVSKLTPLAVSIPEDPESQYGRALAKYSLNGEILRSYGDDQQGILIQRYAPESYRYIFYRIDGTASAASDSFATELDAARDAYEAASKYQKFWLHTHRNSHWLKRLKADAERAAARAEVSTSTGAQEPRSGENRELAELEGGSARPISESAYGKALTSPKRTGDVVTRYGDDDRGILIERTPEGYAAVFYREAHPISLSRLRFDTKESAALGALTTAKGVYGDWLKANRKTEWAKRLRADAKSSSRKMFWG